MSYTPLQIEIPPSPTMEDILASATNSSATAHPAHDTQQSLTPTRQARPSQNVLARLQALFPQASSSSLRNSNAPTNFPSQPPTRPVPPPPKCLKVRILTWNMHDSLPKGELDELLGMVPPADTDQNSATPDVLPSFSNDPGHLYHIIVVAGQECPSSSAIPKGISAGFRSRDRSKTKLDDKEDVSRRWSHDEDRDSLPVPEAITGASGWSLILEDWFCNGAGPPPSTQSSPRPPLAPAPGLLKPPHAVPLPPSPQPPHRSFSADDGLAEPRAKANGEPRKGPYELLTKERLMGIYIAVFVHRDVRPFVKGVSKGTVTAGLIGGRMGNKGGVGVSLKIEDTSLLFLNAHLAAHEGKVPSRLANFAKIKAELSVDEFMRPNDPREMQEDITDRFDYTFLCGDLNFRLDITRLHADWLISRKEYEQALAFDQLRNIMRNGQAFTGFNEGPINFPPTFKYDVLRSLKRSKSRKERERPAHTFGLSEVEEREIEDNDEDDDSEEGEGEGDATSVTSGWPMSIQSRRTNGENEEEDYFQHASSVPPSPKPPSAAVAAQMVQKGVSKAKAKWISLLTPGATGSPIDPSFGRPASLLSSASKRMSTLTLPPLNSKTTPNSPTLPSTPSIAVHGMKHSKSAPSASTSSGVRKTSSSKRPTSTKSGKGAEDTESEDEVDKGVYDSSSKQRVPSWCDRILWKSTVFPEPDPEEEEVLAESVGRPRNRVSQLFQNALRPLRSRRESTSTLSSLERDHGSASGHHSPTASPTEELGDPTPPTSPFSRFTQHGTPQLTKSHSVEHISSIVTKPTSRRPPRTPPQPQTAGYSDSSTVLRSATSIPLVQSNTIQPIVTTPRRPTSSRGRTVSSSSIGAPMSANTPQGAGAHGSTLSAHKWSFLKFLSRDSSQTSILPERPATPDPATPRYPRKGEVMCLDYRTLDDKGMRKLEGRSDHRPVIGSYAIYV